MEDIGLSLGCTVLVSYIKEVHSSFYYFQKLLCNFFIVDEEDMTLMILPMQLIFSCELSGSGRSDWVKGLARETRLRRTLPIKKNSYLEVKKYEYCIFWMALSMHVMPRYQNIRISQHGI